MEINKIPGRVRMCPYQHVACEHSGSSRCLTCEHGPQDIITEEVIARFKEEPWAIYCLTCGQFITTRYNHPEDHIMATGIRDCIAKIPDHVLKTLKGGD